MKILEMVDFGFGEWGLRDGGERMKDEGEMVDFRFYCKR